MESSEAEVLLLGLEPELAARLRGEVERLGLPCREGAAGGCDSRAAIVLLDVDSAAYGQTDIKALKAAVKPRLVLGVARRTSFEATSRAMPAGCDDVVAASPDVVAWALAHAVERLGVRRSARGAA